MTTAHHKRKPIVKDNRSFFGKLWQLLQSLVTGFLGFALLSGVVIAVLYYGSLRSFSQQKYPQRFVITSSVLDEHSNPFLLVFVDQDHTKLTFLKLSETLKMNVLGGYGDYELRSVGSLLNMEKKPVQFMRSAYALGLDQGLDDIVFLDKLKIGAVVNPKSILWQTVISTQAKTTLSWWQRWQLFCFAWSLPDNKIEVKQIDSVSAWQSWQKTQSQAVDPSCSLSVINNTDKAKLATKISQVLENSGVRVVRTTTEGDQLKPTEIVVSPSAQDCEFSLRQAERLLPFASIKPRVDSAADSKYRADVVILVGNDLGDLVDPSATLQ